MDKRFVVIDVKDISPEQLEKQMNELHEQGYKRVFQSDILWYQGKGDCGVVVFEYAQFD